MILTVGVCGGETEHKIKKAVWKTEGKECGIE
jgi:hypothetical protein